jgi:hypothetical protein
LINLAVRAAQLEGVPVFELNTSREARSACAIARSLKITTKTTIALTTTACDWIAEHQPALESLMSPVYRPMIVPLQPMSLSGGGYLVNPLPLLKREPNKRTQRLRTTTPVGFSSTQNGSIPFHVTLPDWDIAQQPPLPTDTARLT